MSLPASPPPSPAGRDQAPLPPEQGWYVRGAFGDQSEVLGPVDLGEVQRVVAAGSAEMGDLMVWHPTYPVWVRAAAVPGISAQTRLPWDAATGAAAADRLPLGIVAGIVACFFLYFGQKALRPLQSPPLAARASVVDPADQNAYELEVCNHTGSRRSTTQSGSDRLYLAVGYFDAARAAWVARGWFPQERGRCQAILKNLRPPIYVYAESRDGKAAWGQTDPGRTFCIDGHGAFIKDQAVCERTGRRQHFKALRLSGNGGVHTWELAD